MCCKEYPKLFCPTGNKRAVDYINDWIDSANVVIQEYGKDLLEIQSILKYLETFYPALETLPAIIAEVELLKTYTVGGASIDLAKLAAITNLFTFDSTLNITGSSIIFDPTLPALAPPYDGQMSLAIIDNNDNTLKKGISFNGDSTTFLSGDGTFQSITIPSYGIIEVTREQLLSLISSKALVAGAKYRITDYQTIVLSEDCEHTYTHFDIIAFAIDDQTLNENVIFTHNASDTYFDGCDLDTWQGKYCIYNDVTRFDFINAYMPMLLSDNGTTYIRDAKSDTGTSYAWAAIDQDAYTVKNIVEPYLATGTAVPTGLITFKTVPLIYTKMDNPVSGEVIYDDLDLPTGAFVSNYFPVSKGVVYYLKDEFNNEAAYDFKSIKFSFSSENVYGYTFSQFGTNYTISDDASLHAGKVYNNTIKPYYADNFVDSASQSHTRISLNKICMASPCVNNYYGQDVSDVIVLGECTDNIWEGDSHSNVFRNSVVRNTFSCGFASNVFDIKVRSNKIMADFQSNQFIFPTHTNIEPGNDLEFACNKIGSDFKNNNILMPRFVGNTIGKSFSNNTLQGTVGPLTIGGQLYLGVLYTSDKFNFINNIIAKHCNRNTIKGCALNTTIGNEFILNNVSKLINSTIGNNIQRNTLDSILEDFTLDGNNRYIKINTSTCKNLHISQGCEYIEVNNDIQNALVEGSVMGVPGGYKSLIYRPSDVGLFINYISGIKTNRSV